MNIISWRTHAGHCSRSRDKLISVSRPTRTYLYQRWVKNRMQDKTCQERWIIRYPWWENTICFIYIYTHDYQVILITSYIDNQFPNSCHPSQSFIALAWFSRLLSVSCTKCVCGWEESLLVSHPWHVHKRTSFMSLYLLLKQFPACPRFTLMVFKMQGKWPYSCFVSRYIQDLFKIIRSILI